MISYEEALQIIHKAPQLTPLTLPVCDALGHVTAQDIKSTISVPSFDNSAMDGFAVRCADLVDASTDTPTTLPITGTTVAGDSPAICTEGAWRIMTGAPIPQGCDAVVKIEDTSTKGQNITFTAPVDKKTNIRFTGEDFSAGKMLIKSGILLTPYHLMALAAVGQHNIKLYPQPNVTVLSTGKELENAEKTLKQGKIYNSNSPYLMAALSELPAQAHYGGLIADEPKLFEKKIKKYISNSTIIISTGAVSAGIHDFIPSSLKKMGAEILFHKVAIRPGKPMLYARFPNGTHYFGLPGNPVSATVGLRFFVTALLFHIQGMPPERPLTTQLPKNAPTNQKMRFFRKTRIAVNSDGKLELEILRGQESFKILPLLNANCWTSFGAHQRGVKGEDIEIYPLMPGQWNLQSHA